MEQRITTGLEGVTVQDFVGDIPTWGFAGADDPSGFLPASDTGALPRTTTTSLWASINDTLPVFEGIYLALDATESYTLTFSGHHARDDVIMDIPQTAFNVLVGNATNANANSKH